MWNQGMWGAAWKDNGFPSVLMSAMEAAGVKMQGKGRSAGRSYLPKKNGGTINVRQGRTISEECNY